MTTQIISLKSPDTATTLTQGTNFYLDSFKPGMAREVKTTRRRKSYNPITKFDKGGDLTFTLSGVCTTYAQYKALMDIAVVWPGQYTTTAFITLKELYSTAVFGGANVSRSWPCMLVSIDLPMTYKGEVEGCKFNLSLKVVGAYTDAAT